jgi:hypothetical protein
MSNSGHLYQYWYKWESKLKTLVEARRARLIFPAIREKQGTRDLASPGVLTFDLESPICILDAPQKGSSQRNTKRMHILIDGTFKFAESGGHPCLLHASCNVTLFDRHENDADGTLDVVLADALHFDVESPDAQGKRKGFHPFFHVQRGISHDDQRVKEVFAAATKKDVTEVRVDQTARDRIGHPYLRIPTPQLDLFAVMTMIAADCFCNPGDADPMPAARAASQAGTETRAELLFADLLKLLTEGSNVVREGTTARALITRVTQSNLMSAGHWYPEWA